MKLRAATATALLGTALAVTSATAAELPVGEQDGVRVKSYRGAVAVVFTPRAEKLYRRIAGRVISIECTNLPERRRGSLVVTNTQGEKFRAPKRRRTLVTDTVPYRGSDFCRVWRAKTKRSPRTLIVSVPVTQQGAVKLDEEEKAGELLQLLITAQIVAEDRGSEHWPTADVLLNATFDGRTLAESWPGGVVALRSPSDTPPGAATGYWSDGREHAAAVVVTAAGRRLFLELDADDVLRTNVAEYVFEGPE